MDRSEPAKDYVEDPLALFESEAALTRSGQPPPLRQSSPPMVHQTEPDRAPQVSARAPAGPALQISHERSPLTLSEVLDRLGSVEWVEAVAVVREVCTAVTATGTESVPDLSGVLVTGHGTVQPSRGGIGTGPPGPRLARLLHSLVAGGTVPPPLRLLITKWVAFTGEHSTKTFATELAYFARPDGAALIRAMYERAAAAARASAGTPRPAATKQGRSAQSRRSPRFPRHRRFVAAALAAASATAGVWVWLYAPADRRVPFDLSATFGHLADAARNVVIEAGGQLGVTLPAPPPSPPSENPASSAPGRMSGPGAREAAPPERSTPRSSALAADARRLGTAALPPTSDQQALTAGGQPAAVTASSPPAASRAAEEPGQNEADRAQTLYSSADLDVKPPELRFPQLPLPLLRQSAAELNTMEVIVSEDGTVERVRLLTEPRRMADMMLLSGAKAWVFEPASREGHAVRYRLRFSWAATP